MARLKKFFDTGNINWNESKNPIKKINIKNSKMEKLDLSTIVQVPFPTDQYYSNVTPKNQICLHHTVSGNGISGDVRHWIGSKARVATPIIVERDGTINQCFSSRKWAHHLGVKQVVFNTNHIHNMNNKMLNQGCIGVEIDSWGWLKKDKKGVFTSTYGHKIDKEDVQVYKDKYRGHLYYEKYTEEQIESVRQLLVYWSSAYGIPLQYNEDMFEVSIDALRGKKGVWSHTSFRADKSDIHPQPEMIKMLKSLCK